MRLQQPGRRVASFALFSNAEITCLKEAALKQEFRTAQSEITHKGRAVFQDFDVCFPAPRQGVFDRLATLLETGLWRAALTSPCSPFEAPFRLVDFAIQHYPPGSRGIGIHRDGARYRDIVVIINLGGDSRLFTCNDRAGSGKRRIDDRPGRVVLLSAGGFNQREGDDARPLHGVDQVRGGRLSVGFRTAPVKAA